jgi:hypothetical protein
MMPLGYSEINENIKISQNKKKNRRKTIKKRDSNNRVEKFLNSMNKKESFEPRGVGRERSTGASTRKSIKGYDSDEDEMGEPYEHQQEEISEPKNVQVKHESETPNVMDWDKDKLESFGLLREGLTQQEQYQKDQSRFINQYMPSYSNIAQNVPYYSQLANSQNISGSRDELMRKLNHIVHMLEEQQDEKTGSVTEELVLYMFLGVFVIFVVDSFSRVSKYTR